MTHQSLYLEINYANGNFERLEQAWMMVIARHPLLQQYRSSSNELRSADNCDYPIALYDLRNQPTAKIGSVEKILRDNLTTIPCSDTQWPWFVIKAVLYDSGDVRFFMSFAPSMLSCQQIYYLLREWLALYQNPDAKLHSLTLTPPTIPSQPNYELKELRYQHLMGRLDHNVFAKLRHTSDSEQISLPLAIATVFNDQMTRQNLQYPFYITLANRFPLYPYSFDQAFFATSLASTPLILNNKGTLQERCHAVEGELRKTSSTLDTDKLNSLIAPQQPELFSLFSCNLEQNLKPGPLSAKPADIIYSNFALPLPVIDISVWEQAGQLLYRWSYLDINVAGQSITKDLATLPEEMPLSTLFDIKLSNATTQTTKKIILDPGVILLGAGLIKGNYTAPTEENLVPLESASLETATKPVDAKQPVKSVITATATATATATEKVTTTSTAATPSIPEIPIEIPNGANVSGIGALEKIIGSAIVGAIATTVTNQAQASAKSSNNASTSSAAAAAIAVAIPTAAAGANVQAANTAAFNGGAHQLTQLSMQPASWQAPNTVPLAPHAATTLQPSAGYISTLQKMPADSPTVGFAQQLSTIRNTPVISPDLSKISPPSVEQLSKMSPDEMQKSYQQYSEARANLLAQPATAAKNNSNILNSAFSGILVAAGSSAALIKPQMSDIGKNLDGLNNALAKGNQAAVNTHLDEIQKLHEDIVEKMSQYNIPAENTQNPLHQATYDLQNSLDAVAKKKDPAAAQNFINKTNEFAAEYDKHEQVAKPVNPAVIMNATQSIADAQEKQKDSEKLKEISQSLDNLQGSTDKLGTFKCPDIATPEGQATISNAQAEAQRLQTMLPTVTNPAAQQMADAQANLTTAQNAASTIQSAGANVPSIPTPGMPEDAAALQSSAQGLSNNANDLASSIQSKCPICTHGLPDMPEPPAINANLPDLVNPFTLPLALVGSMLSHLGTLPNMPKIPNMPDLSGAQNKLQDLQSRMQGYGPDAALNELTTAATNAAANNPWQQYSSKISGLQSQLTTMDTNFTTHCPNYQAVLDGGSSAQQKVQGALGDLSGAQDKLKSLLGGSTSTGAMPDPSQFMSSSPDMAGSLSSLQSGLFSTIQQVSGNPGTPPDLKQALANAATNASNSLICNKHQAAGGFPPSAGGGAAATPKDLLASNAKVQCAMGSAPQNLTVLPIGAKVGNMEAAKLTDFLPFIGMQAAPQCMSPTNPANIPIVIGAPCIPLQLPLPPYTDNATIISTPLPQRQTPVLCGLCAAQSKVSDTNTKGAVAT